MKILHLSLKKEPFEVMVTGEKKHEFRKNSRWINSRLYGKSYDVVKFVNGYGSDKPYFIAEYLGYDRVKYIHQHYYSNGLVVTCFNGDFVINLGKIIEKGNI